jgi:hypothetical protein
MLLYRVTLLDENPVLGIIRQNGSSRLISGVVGIPNIGFSFKRITL